MLIHVVKPGEALWQIANFYRVPAASIVEVNELPDPNRLAIGQALVIPTEDIFHTVVSGESLWKIAQAYGTTVQAILQNNQIANPNNIYPGLILYIPALRYRIQPGDTLWSVAQRFGVSLNSLIKVNNIENANLVYPGTVLVIPRKPRPSIDVNGYIYILGEEAAPTLKEVGEHLTYLSPFAYLIREDGTFSHQ